MTVLAHETVLLAEAVDALVTRTDGLYVDGTFGRGGHSREILKRLAPNARLVVIDKDPLAIAEAERLAAEDARVRVCRGSFASMSDLLADEMGKVAGVLLDLGVSSPQLDDPERGFSFMRAGPLDMRMDPESGLSVAQWLQTAAEADIAKVLWELGEERHSRRIARSIVARRVDQPLQTTTALAELIAQAAPSRDRHKHPATRSFQALRIYINRELDDLAEGLRGASDLLATGGRLVVISFHSLEDRMVKRFMRDQSSMPELPRGLPVRQSDIKGAPCFRLVGKAVQPGEDEIARNPRSRSAVMRVLERTTVGGSNGA